MASTDATLFPVNGQAYRTAGVIRSSASGNPVTGGLTTLAATVSKDGGAFGAIAGTVTEIGTTGYFYLDLTAADMTGNLLVVHVTAANANAMYDSIVINTADLAETTDHAYDHSVKKLEQYISQAHAYMWNKQTMTETGAETIYKADGTTTLAARTVGVSGTLTTAERMG